MAKAKWWAPSYLMAALGLVGGIASWLTAEPLGVTVCCFAIVVIAGTSQIRTRTEFRRGWRHGYESAIRTALEYQAGRTPDIEARVAVLGDPVPEPWEQHVSPVKPRTWA